jgi:hypothetical protein
MDVTLRYDNNTTETLPLPKALDRIQALQQDGEALMDGTRRLFGVSNELAAELAGYLVKGQDKQAARTVVNTIADSKLSLFQYRYQTGQIKREQLGGIADQLDAQLTLQETE